MDDRYLNWSKIDLFVITRFFVFAGSGFVVGRLWASEALHVPEASIELAYGTLKYVLGASGSA